MWGCAGGPRPCKVDLDDLGWGVAQGKPRDLDAALRPALTLVGFVEVDRIEGEPGRFEYELVNAKGEPGTVEIVLSEGRATDARRGVVIEHETQTMSIRVRAALTRVGDARAERGLVCAFVDRLEQLNASGTRPLEITR